MVTFCNFPVACNPKPRLKEIELLAKIMFPYKTEIRTYESPSNRKNKHYGVRVRRGVFVFMDPESNNELFTAFQNGVNALLES